MKKYKLVSKKGEGTFSEVLKAQNIIDGKFRAIKCMKSHYQTLDQVNSLREIQALRKLSPHPNIISLDEVLFDKPTGRLALVFELMDANLYELIRGRKHHLNKTILKSYMYQMFKALDYMHGKGIFHRDIKPENILVEKSGTQLKLADFGSCRGIYSKQPYTEYISTRWYRAPECLLTNGYYGPEMDIWGAGCVFFELVALYPLFPGTDEIDQINRIHKVLGTPSADILVHLKLKGNSNRNFHFPPQRGIGIAQLIPHAGPECIDLLSKTIKYDPNERISAEEVMMHTYFAEKNPKSSIRSQLSQSKESSKSQCNVNPSEPKTVSHRLKKKGSVRKLKKLRSKSSLPQLVEKSEESIIDRWRNNVIRDMKKKASEIIDEPSPQKQAIKKLGSQNNLKKGLLPPVNLEGNVFRGKKVLSNLSTHTSANISSTKNRTRKMTQKQQKPVNNHESIPKRRKNKLYAHITSTGYGAVGKRSLAKNKSNPNISAAKNSKSDKPHYSHVKTILQEQGSSFGSKNKG